MGTKTFTRTLKAFVTLAMLQSPVSFEVNAAEGSKCKPLNSCYKEVEKAQASGAASALLAKKNNKGGASGGGGALEDASNGTASAACTAQSQCSSIAEKCQDKKDGCVQKDCDKIKELAAKAGGECQQALGAAGGAGDTKNAASGGGDGSALAALAPLAMAAAMMAMQKKKKDDKPPQPDPNSAWNGVQLDCSKPDAHMFQACNGQMEQKCAANMDDPTCVMFESRYCVGQTGTGVGGTVPAVIAAQPQVDPATGMVLGVPVMGSPSEGVGTQFCSNYTAYNFCKGAGRSSCPSCERLRANASAICAQRPADCMQSNSQAVMQQAAQTCPSDPAFANPNWNAGNTVSGVPSTMSGVSGGGGGTILPQSVGGKPIAAGGSASAGNGTGALQEGQAIGGQPGSNGGGTAGNYGGRAFATPGGSRELASSGMNYQPSSAGGEAPAPDVQARNSPNLFQTGSSVIKYKCDTGRLNCP